MMTPVVNFEGNKNIATLTANEIGELKGLLASAREQKLTTAIIRIPVRMFAIDETYQTKIRTERNLNYLVNDFRKEKLLPVTGVPHDEEGKIYLVDGYGRWKASQIVDKNRGTHDYESLECMVILNAPTEPVARRKYEAEQYAFQNKNVARVTPLQKHGAYEIMGEPAALIIDEMKEKYQFEFLCEKGNRSCGVLGSYSELFHICRAQGKPCVEYIFDTCYKAGFHLKQNGYSTYVMRALRDMWRFYPDNRKETSAYLAEWLRERDPANFKAKAVARYGLLDIKAACSLYLEDLLVDNIDMTHVRQVKGKTITMVA